MDVKDGPPPADDALSALMTKVLDRLGDLVLEHHRERGDDRIHVARENIVTAARMLRDSPELAFDMLLDVTAVDYLGQSDGFRLPPVVWDQKHSFSRRLGQSRHRLVLPERGSMPRFAVVYHLLSTRLIHRLRIKCRVPEDDPAIPSVTPVWAGANWLERETYDLYGIRFTGHPDLRRIYLYDEFVGHPLRKDYAKHDEQPIQEYLGPGANLPRRPLSVRPE
jgi:NADH-quinone oxidoreductase subunit C